MNGVSLDNERSHWSLRTPNREHDLDVVPSAFGQVSVHLDGRKVLSLSNPSPRKPLSEASLSVDGVKVIVVLTWRDRAMQADVFEDGRSLHDGRSLDRARASAPGPLTGYDSWFRAGFAFTKGSLAPKPILWLLVAGLVANLLVASSSVAGPGAGAIVTVGGAAVVAAAVWYWIAFTVAVHRYLVRHPELGDVRRAVILVTSFAGFPAIISAAVVLIGLLVHGVL